MLIGENLHYSDVMEHLMPLEESLGRTINPTLYTPQDWAAKMAVGNSFVLRVAQQEKNHADGSRSNGVQGWRKMKVSKIWYVREV